MNYHDQAALGIALEKLVEAFVERTGTPPSEAWELVEQIARDRT